MLQKRIIFPGKAFGLLLGFFLLSGGHGAQGQDKIRIGLVEDIILLNWGIRMPARIDTGAAQSSLDAREFMAVGLLPFVILTMVIERFFVLIEETGAREGLSTAAGSAAVAVISYQIISWEPLQLTFFVYPELLAAIAAFQIFLGRYTGYRISELIRFRTLRKAQ
jgi:hypothetical protein